MRHRWLAVLLISLSSTAWALGPAVASALAQGCPLASDDQVSGVVGTPVRAPFFFVVVSGPNTQCLFEGAGVGEGILIARYSGLFGSEAVQPFSADHPQFPTMLPTGSEVDLAPVEGIGEVAAWATARNPGAAPDGLGRLLIRQGADAYVVGVQNGPDAVTTASAVAQMALTR